MGWFTKDNTDEPKSLSDASDFSPHAKDENGVMVQNDSTNDVPYPQTEPPKDKNKSRIDKRASDRRQGAIDRRTGKDRRILSVFNIRYLWPFNRRSGYDNRKIGDRRYGSDRRLFDIFASTELHKQQADAMPTEGKIVSRSKNSNHGETETFIASQSVYKTPVYSKQGLLIAETFCKNAMFDDTGNNYIHICHVVGENAFIQFDDKNNNALLHFAQEDDNALSLTQSLGEVIYMVVNNDLRIQIDPTISRNIMLLHDDNVKREVGILKLSEKIKQEIYTTTLVINGLGDNIKIDANNNICFGNMVVGFDSRQIVNIVDEHDNIIQVSGISGNNNLAKYIDSAAKL